MRDRSSPVEIEFDLLDELESVSLRVKAKMSKVGAS